MAREPSSGSPSSSGRRPRERGGVQEGEGGPAPGGREGGIRAAGRLAQSAAGRVLLSPAGHSTHRQGTPLTHRQDHTVVVLQDLDFTGMRLEAH